MEPSLIISTPEWVKIVSNNFAVLTVRYPGNSNLFVNSIDDDETAVQLAPAETDTTVNQDEDKDVWIRSPGSKPWTLRLETAG